MRADGALAALGLKRPRVLLPAPHVPLGGWAVVACDQFTSQPEYWDEADRLAGDMPSALRLILPEAWLSRADSLAASANEAMRSYMDGGVFVNACHSFVLVRRETSSGTRHGLIALLDLEQYDYAETAQSRARATEGTIVERIPPRVRVRQDAPLELPHVLVLIDDPGFTVIEPIAKMAGRLRQLYAFDLMLGGGRIAGFAVEDEDIMSMAASALARLDDGRAQMNKYGLSDPEKPFTYAVGDGNHSLATAKAVWENTKPALSAAELDSHPARYAMVELVNLHSESLVFEPIHRALFGVEPEKTLLRLYEWAQKQDGPHGVQRIAYVADGDSGEITVPRAPHPLPVGTLQAFLDEYLLSDPSAGLDYIHGDDVLRRLCRPGNALGFLLPKMGKDALFPGILKGGPLPRKTFSMGHASDKRYYLEARRILP